MTSKIISRDDNEIIIQVKVSLKGSMLETEQSILESINQAGVLATGEALKQFDTDGEAIVIGGIKFTSRVKNGKSYQTPYGVVGIERHVYQTSKGGKIHVPLESAARIIQGATPRFAKILSHKYSNLPAPAVIEDLINNHDRKVAVSYLQNITDYVGGIAQAKEESWEYECPKHDKEISTIAVSLDGAYINTVEDGFREGMTGAVAFYGKEGDRIHTIYIGAAPEYGKETFLARFEREITSAKTVGVADGAQSNWSFLEKHTSTQILDFWHASEYLSEASHALFTKKSENKMRKVWLEQQCHNLKHKKGAAARILSQLKECTSKHLRKTIKEELGATITYFTNNIEAGRMKYYLHIKNNLPIGSGVIEAACKTIIKSRLCGSGMRWKTSGMKAILSLRPLVKTKGRWNQFWEKIDISGIPTLC